MEALLSCFMLKRIVKRFNIAAKVVPEVYTPSPVVSTVSSSVAVSEISLEEQTPAIEISTSPEGIWHMMQTKYGDHSPRSDLVAPPVRGFHHTSTYITVWKMQAEDQRRRQEKLMEDIEEYLKVSPRRDMVALPNCVEQ